MTLRLFLASFVIFISSLASAAQITKFPINGVTLTYNEKTNQVYATGTLVSGSITMNSLSTVSINGEFTGRFEVDLKGRIRLAMKNSGAFLVGQVQKDNSITLDVPFQAYQVSESYDLIEKSFGLVDVEYITLDIQL